MLTEGSLMLLRQTIIPHPSENAFGAARVLTTPENSDETFEFYESHDT